MCGDVCLTHGAFGALAHGIGNVEVEHVLATQTLIQAKAKNFDMLSASLAHVTAKDIALAIIGEIGTAGGTGYVLEYAGPAIEALSMEGRMTLCNMSIEAGARAGLIAPDEKTFAFLKGRAKAPQGADWDAAIAYWQTLKSDDAVFDKEIVMTPRPCRCWSLGAPARKMSCRLKAKCPIRPILPMRAAARQPSARLIIWG